MKQQKLLQEFLINKVESGLMILQYKKVTRKPNTV